MFAHFTNWLKSNPAIVLTPPWRWQCNTIVIAAGRFELILVHLSTRLRLVEHFLSNNNKIRLKKMQFIDGFQAFLLCILNNSIQHIHTFDKNVEKIHSTFRSVQSLQFIFTFPRTIRNRSTFSPESETYIIAKYCIFDCRFMRQILLTLLTWWWRKIVVRNISHWWRKKQKKKGRSNGCYRTKLAWWMWAEVAATNPEHLQF